MPIEEVIERSTITFERPLPIEDFRVMLQYVARHLPSEIEYDTRMYRTIILNPEGEGVIPRNGAVRVEGTIRSVENPVASDFFKTSHSVESITMIESIKFIGIPGYELNEYPEARLQLWDDVRKLVGEYLEL